MDFENITFTPKTKKILRNSNNINFMEDENFNKASQSVTVNFNNSFNNDIVNTSSYSKDNKTQKQNINKYKSASTLIEEGINKKLKILEAKNVSDNKHFSN